MGASKKNVPASERVDNDLNIFFSKTQPKCRFYGIDMDKYASFKHNHVDELYEGSVYWRQETKIFKDL